MNIETNSLWSWQPVPPGKDYHSEWAQKSDTLSAGFNLIAARVRGKRHKHEGTHCDDWFEIARSGEWGIIAVSDGAGSKRFSRVGARVACERAVNYLVKQLHTHQIVARKIWSNETFARNKGGQFKAQDIELTQQFLHEAIQAAYQGIEDACCARDRLKYYYKALGHRDLTLDDFATTLLLAVHTTVFYHSTQYSLVLACQVGDGLSVAIDKNKALVLGEIENNHFCGETHFLTSSRRQLERDYLSAKTFPFFSPMQALMVMTDGVSDDYYPPDTGMLRLFGDLILNGIIPVTVSDCREKRQAIVKAEAYTVIEERITEKGRIPTPIVLIDEYAKILKLSIAELMADPDLLAAGIPLELLEKKASIPASRLLTWLDTYQIRGSFDDRTLVVLYNR